jgi:hypothetical protein
MHRLSQIENKIGNWMKKNSRQRATANAVSQTTALFARQHPQWAQSLVDEIFLTNAVQASVQRQTTLDPVAMADEWTKQLWYRDEEMRQTHVKRLAPMMAELLDLLSQQLSNLQIASPSDVFSSSFRLRPETM